MMIASANGTLEKRAVTSSSLNERFRISSARSKVSVIVNSFMERGFSFFPSHLASNYKLRVIMINAIKTLN